MEFLKNFRVRVGRFLLNRQNGKVQRKKRVHNLNTANNIGFVYVYKNEDEFRIVEDIISELRTDLKNVKALVYLPYDKLKDYVPQKLSIDYISPADLNWVYHPGKKYSNEFVRSKFDVLIDLNFSDFFPLDYVMTVTKADFKVGLYDEKKASIYDLMIKVSKEERIELAVKEIMDFLKLLQPA